jgi:hypothetical protein
VKRWQSRWTSLALGQVKVFGGEKLAGVVHTPWIVCVTWMMCSVGRLGFCVRPEGYEQGLYGGLMKGWKKQWKRVKKEKGSQSAELIVALEASDGMV